MSFLLILYIGYSASLRTFPLLSHCYLLTLSYFFSIGYSVLVGQIAQAARRMTWAGRPGSIPGAGEWRFFFTPSCQAGPRIYSASYKRLPVTFPGGEGGRGQEQSAYLFLYLYSAYDRSTGTQASPHSCQKLQFSISFFSLNLHIFHCIVQ